MSPSSLGHPVLQPFPLEGCSEQVLNLFLEPHRLHLGPTACRSPHRIPNLAETSSAKSIPAPSTHCPSCRRVIDPSRSPAYPVLCCPSVPGQPPPWDTPLASPWEKVAVRDAGPCLPYVLCPPVPLATPQPRASTPAWAPLSSPSPFPSPALYSIHQTAIFFLPIFIYCPNSIIPTIKERKRTHNATTLWRQQPQFLHQPQSAAVPFQACPRTVGCNFYRAMVSVPPPQTPRWTWGPWGSVFPLSWHLTGCSGIMSGSPSSSKLNPLKEGPLSVPPTRTPSTGLTQSRHSEPQSGVDGMDIALFFLIFIWPRRVLVAARGILHLHCSVGELLLAACSIF